MKSKNKDKDLRRKVEILKAQLSTSKDVYIPKQETPPQKKISAGKTNHVEVIEKINTTQIKKDLFKTILLSALAFSVIFTLKII
jgi:hypothetical protein